MQTFDILDQDIDIFQSRFLEASAGTGKTFAIENLVIRLLLESKKSLTLQEILAVTFTREAAQEMKTRIRFQLQQLASEKNPKALEALACFDEIQVFTIHGFCHRMLSEFAFEAKTPLIISDPDSSDHNREMAQVVIDFLQTGDAKYSGEVTALLKRVRYDFDRFVMRIVEAMQRNEEPLSFTLPTLPTVSAEKLLHDLLELAPKYKRIKFEKFHGQIEKFAAYLEQRDPKLLISEKTWFFEKLKEETGFFHHLQKELVPMLQILRDPTQMLCRIAKECRKRWEQKARRFDHLTFDDLLQKMLKALENPPFFQKVREKYKAVIVDEFQDTDPIQWQIFKKLFTPNHLLYLVGDPKQSIYGFRNADIYTYLEAAQTLSQKAFLDTNYRSSPKLISALNELFTKNSHWLDLPSLPGILEYHPVKAGRKEGKLTESPITFFGAEADPGLERSWPTKTMEEEQIFPYIAQEILRLETSFSFGDFVILIKDRFQAQRMQKFLSRYKIPSTIKKTLHLCESRGFQAMEMLLRAISHPENHSEVQAVLKGPLMQGDQNPFFELRQIFIEKGFASALKHFLDCHFCNYSDAELYLEFSQTVELLLQSHLADCNELIHLMQEWKKMSPEREEKLQLRGEEGPSKVAIMTTFASKGLEFEVVFALGLACRHEEAGEEREAEKMRQLYVGFTRAKEKLYIPILTDLSKKTSLALSPIEKFFENHNVPVEKIKNINLKPYKDTSENEIKLAPPSKVSLNFKVEILTSFSAMSKASSRTLLKEQFQIQDLSKKTAHTLPLGAETGTVIHAVFEAYFANRKSPIEQIVCETLSGTHLEGWEEVISEMIEKTLSLPLFESFTLNQLQEGDYFQEMEFLYKEKNQWVKGFVDLVFKQGDTFYLLDWKTNWLGSSDAEYTDERMHLAMKEHDYFLQAKIYEEALYRYVKQLYTNPQFGGIFYVFIRGNKAVQLGTC